MKVINGKVLQSMVVSGANNLHNHYKEIDALNVFPVPDGDTGTNMSLTMAAGAKDVSKLNTTNAYEVSRVLSKGLLMGARGNSGVILSQIFRGFAQGLENCEEVDAVALARAFKKGSEIAYKAVMKPVEGTILTVIRESSEETALFVKKNKEADVSVVLEYLIQRANESLERTPDLLPVLKEVGAVDSGGAGFIKILDGFMSVINGVEIDRLDVDDQVVQTVSIEHGEDQFGYCTEFIMRLDTVKGKYFNEDYLREDLAKMGDSIVVVQDEDIIKVHVHTLTPGKALELGQRFGEFVTLKIENMQEQHNHLNLVEAPRIVISSEVIEETMAIEEVTVAPKTSDERKEYALIAVAAGEGLERIFHALHCDYVVSGGQTMNPSIEDFVEAARRLNAKNVFILPNNSNIVLAANQASDLLEGEINVKVIPSKTIPQGLAACVMFNPESRVEDNVFEMSEAIKQVKTGEVTFAVRDTKINGMKIKANDFMGIYEKDIVVSVPDRLDALKQLLSKMITKDDSLMTIIVGEDVATYEQDQIRDYVEANYDVELEIYIGDQPVYSFIVGVE